MNASCLDVVSAAHLAFDYFNGHVDRRSGFPFIWTYLGTDPPKMSHDGWDTVEVTPRRREQHDLLGLLGMHKDDLVEIVPNITPKRKRRARINYGDRQELETGSVIVDLVTSEMPDAEIPRAVILRDSFGMSLVPFLAEHFGHATYLWTTDPTLKQIERERPSVVIWEITERFLMHPVPKPWADAG